MLLGFPRRVGKAIDEAKRYAESTAIRIEVQAPEDIELWQALPASNSRIEMREAKNRLAI